MIPLNNTVRLRTFPLANLTLISLNVLVFLYELRLEPGQLERFVAAFSIIPPRVLSAEPAGLISLVTGMFIHAGWAHLITNMWALFIFGGNVEERMGTLRYSVFFLSGGVFAGLSQVFLTPELRAPIIGASGAVAAVMGAYLLLYPRSRVRTFALLIFIPLFLELPAILFLGIWFLLQFANGVMSLDMGETVGGIAYWAHIGGFLFGLVSVPFFARRRRQPIPHPHSRDGNFPI